MLASIDFVQAFALLLALGLFGYLLFALLRPEHF